MVKLLLSIILTFLAFSGKTKAECPALVDINNMYNSNTFTCARFYYGFGHDLPVRGCSGGCPLAEYSNVPDGANEDAGDGYHYPMGSIMVKPGCTLYVFHDTNYGGKYDKYDGPGIYSKVNTGHDSTDDGCAKGHPSFQCRCRMEPVSCTPQDTFAVVLRCDATGKRL